jgi:mannosyltransferase OCH1-like enzyme
LKYAFSHSNIKITPQAKSDYWRLALIAKHGGIYIDAATFQIDDSLDWVLNLTRLPSKYFWNRYGK